VAYALYRVALGPAIDWGDRVRSSIALHRLEIYDKLGVRAPAERRARMAILFKLETADGLLLHT